MKYRTKSNEDMNEKKREIRTIDCQLSVREQEGGQTGDSRTIAGRAIVFNAESEVIDDWGERFREVILPEAVTMEFLNTQDVKMNMLHERELTIGMDPAYRQTTVNAREMDKQTPEGKRDAEAAEQAKREAEEAKKERERIAVENRERRLRKVGNIIKSLEY